ncbi:putative membrane associated protein [Giardia duodenalis assemblage B]|uniref:Putative membrane associated protein n=1 Tax=Giardia duodenalis assemblage B TaxID=1394984 RepID=A0A132NX00_GIAIN|nr:putative membrane associated protein [Giardia intestinalis assemblage B]
MIRAFFRVKMPLSRPESRQRRSEKRRKSFCTDARATGLDSEMIEALPAQPSLESNAHSETFSNTAPSMSMLLSQGTIEPLSTLAASEADSSLILTNKREKRPRTPKLTKEEKRAASLSARAAKGKKSKGDIVAPELLKTSNTLPVEDPGRSVTTLPESKLSIKLAPIGYEPTHMLSRPLRTYTRRYQPTSPQPLLAFSGASPLSNQQQLRRPPFPADHLSNTTANPPSLLFSYQSSDPNVTLPSTLSISAARPNPPPRRKGALFTLNSVSETGSRHNSHDPETVLHRNLSHCCALPTANDAGSLMELRITHSFSTPITPIGKIPRPVSEADDNVMPRLSDRDDQSDDQFIMLTSSSQAFRRSIPELERGPLPLRIERLDTQANIDVVAPKIAARRPRPMSTSTIVPAPQPSVFAGAEVAPSTIVTSTPFTSKLANEEHLHSPEVQVFDDRFALTAYASAGTSYQTSPPADLQSHTPEVRCSQATAVSASPCAQPKSQTLHIAQASRVSRDTQDHALVSQALGLTDTSLEYTGIDHSPVIRSRQDLLAHEHALDIESAITDVINIESARFGQLASARIRDILIEQTRSIPKGTSPRDVYRLVRSQLNLVDSGLCNSTRSNSAVCDMPSKSRTMSPIILHAVARSESKSRHQKQLETNGAAESLATVRDLVSSKNAYEAEDLVLDTSEPQPSSCLLDNLVITSVDHMVASPRTVCMDEDAISSPVYYCTRISPKSMTLPLNSLQRKHDITPSKVTPRASVDQILEAPSPERSLPSVSSEVLGSIHEKSLTASSLRQSTAEPPLERKSLDFSTNLLPRYDFTPGGTVANVGRSELTPVDDFLLGETYSGKLHFAQRVVYDSTACSFDSCSQTVAPLPLLAMDYDDSKSLLVTVASDNVVRIYNIPALQPDQYDELKQALTDGSSSLTNYNISEPTVSYLPQHAKTFPNASPTVVRLGLFLLSVVGYDDGHISVFDLQSMSEVAYWCTQAQSPIVDLCLYTSIDSKSPRSLSLDSIFSTSSIKQLTHQSSSHEVDSSMQAAPENVNLFICTQTALSTYSLSQSKEQLINMYTHIREDEEVWYSALTQNRDDPREIYIGCVGGTIFRFFDCVPQRRISITQVDKVTALSVHGSTLAIGSNLGMTIIFDTQELQSSYRLRSYKDSPVSAVYCDRTKIIIANTSGVLTIWDKRDHFRCVYSSLVHTASITNLRVARNRVFTAAADGYTNCFEFCNSHLQNNNFNTPVNEEHS